jgi:hypothetical protein
VIEGLFNVGRETEKRLITNKFGHSGVLVVKDKMVGLIYKRVFKELSICIIEDWGCYASETDVMKKDVFSHRC